MRTEGIWSIFFQKNPCQTLADIVINYIYSTYIKSSVSSAWKNYHIKFYSIASFIKSSSNDAREFFLTLKNHIWLSEKNQI